MRAIGAEAPEQRMSELISIPRRSSPPEMSAAAPPGEPAEAPNNWFVQAPVTFEVIASQARRPPP